MKGSVGVIDEVTKCVIDLPYDLNASGTRRKKLQRRERYSPMMLILNPRSHVCRDVKVQN